MNKNYLITATIGAVAFVGVGYYLNGLGSHKDLMEIKTDTPLAHVYFVPDPDATQFHAQLILHRGEADMNGPEGIAHYIEHLVAWNALPDRDKTWQRDFNASTTDTFTNYFMDSKDETQVMRYLSGVFAPITLDETYMKEEAQIVLNEFNLRVSENKYFPYFTAIEKKLYEGTGLARSTIGDPKDIADFDPATAIAIYEENYKPEYADLVISGNMSKSEVKELVEAYFGKLEHEETAPRVLATQSIKPFVETRDVINNPDLPVSLTFSGWLFDSNEPLARKNALENLISQIISSEQKNMFTRKLVHEDKDYQGISAGFTTYPEQLGDKFEIYGEMRDGKTPEFLALSFATWLETIKADPELLTPIIEGIVKNEQNNFEKVKPTDIMQSATYDIAEYHAAPIRYADYMKELEKLTPQDIISYLDNILAGSNDVSYKFLK